MFGLSVHTFQSNLNQCYGYCQHTQGLSLGSDPGPPWNQTLRNICHLYTLFLKHRANKRKSWELESVSLAPFHLFHQCSFLPAMCVWPCSPPPPQVAHQDFSFWATTQCSMLQLLYLPLRVGEGDLVHWSILPVYLEHIPGVFILGTHCREAQ